MAARTIQDVIDNLVRTIEGKKRWIAENSGHRTTMMMEQDEEIAHKTAVELMKINVKELDRIMDDVIMVATIQQKATNL